MGNSLYYCCESDSVSKFGEMTLAKNNLSRSVSEPSMLSKSFQYLLDRSQSIAIDEVDIKRRMKILQHLPPTACNLRLKVINDAEFPKGTLFYINPSGLEGSKRGISDGFTYIGYEKETSGSVLNDLVIPINNASDCHQRDGRHFLIAYNIERDSYYLRDLGIGFGVFTRLDYALHIKDGHLLNIGSYFCKFSLRNEHLTIEAISQNNEVLQVLSSYFDTQTTNAAFIQIGRKPGCQIRLQDSLISKVQCTIVNNQSTGWILLDGDLQKQLPSTNGTWLYACEMTEIYNGMVLKVGNMLIGASYIQATFMQGTYV